MKVIRKAFFRITSITAVVVFMMSFASLSSTFDRNDGMIPIVMAYDSLCFNGTVVDSVRVANMVDASIIELTGIVGDMPLAYQCIFPLVTADTKILIKYNPNAPTTTIMPMVNALKKGFCSMLEGNFPEANVTLVGDLHDQYGPDTVMVDTTVIVYDTTIFTFDSLGNPDTFVVSTATTIFAWDANGDPDTIEVPTPTTPSDTIPGQNLKYAIKDVYSNTDYTICCPSAMVDTVIGCGIDMAMSLHLTSIEGVGGATIEDLYPLVLDSIKHSLSVLNFHPTFNGDSSKVCLYMLDLLSYVGPDGTVGKGNRIYTTQNISVLDWKGMRFLSDSVGVLDAAKTHEAQLVCTLSVWPYCDLGVVNEQQMYEIVVLCPTGILSKENISIKNIKVNANQAFTIFSYPREGTAPAVLSIFDIHGREIWSHKSSKQAIVWENKNVSSGVYLYQLKVGKNTIRGKTTIKR